MVAALLHAIWLGLSDWFFVGVDIEVVLAILNGRTGSRLEEISEDVPLTLWYFVTLFLFSYGVGYLAATVLLDWGWELLHPLLRARAPQAYYLDGSILGVSSGGKRKERPDIAVIAVVIEQGGVAYLYEGIHTEILFDSEGNLEQIILTNARRRKLLNEVLPKPFDGFYNWDDTEQFEEIGGDYFIINSADIKTINLRYINFEVCDVGESPGC